VPRQPPPGRRIHPSSLLASKSSGIILALSDKFFPFCVLPPLRPPSFFCIPIRMRSFFSWSSFFWSYTLGFFPLRVRSPPCEFRNCYLTSSIFSDRTVSLRTLSREHCTAPPPPNCFFVCLHGVQCTLPPLGLD